MGDRLAALADAAPDLVAAWEALGGVTDLGVVAPGGVLAPHVLSALDAVAGPGAAARLAPQMAAIAGALSSAVASLPEAAFALPGGEGDWNVAQAIGHTADARAGLALAASFAAAGRFPDAAPPVVSGVPGPADAGRDALLRRIGASQRIVERAARGIEGHELDPCPLDHPLIGRLRCGEWLAWAGVHDLLHLEQLEGIEAGLGGEVRPRP